MKGASAANTSLVGKYLSKKSCRQHHRVFAHPYRRACPMCVLHARNTCCLPSSASHCMIAESHQNFARCMPFACPSSLFEEDMRSCSQLSLGMHQGACIYISAPMHTPTVQMSQGWLIAQSGAWSKVKTGTRHWIV